MICNLAVQVQLFRVRDMTKVAVEAQVQWPGALQKLLLWCCCKFSLYQTDRSNGCSRGKQSLWMGAVSTEVNGDCNGAAEKGQLLQARMNWGQKQLFQVANIMKHTAWWSWKGCPVADAAATSWPRHPRPPDHCLPALLFGTTLPLLHRSCHPQRPDGKHVRDTSDNTLTSVFWQICLFSRKLSWHSVLLNRECHCSQIATLGSWLFTRELSLTSHCPDSEVPLQSDSTDFGPACTVFTPRT